MAYQPRVLLDFDGTIHWYEKWTGLLPEGPPIEGALEFVQGLMNDGYEVVIFTTRCESPDGLEAVQDWLRRYDFPALAVTNVKLPSIALVDDRAVLCNPMMSMPKLAYASARREIERLKNQ